MKPIYAVVLVLSTGCVATTNLSSSSRASGADTSGQVTIPNVFKLPKDQAIAALRSAGVQGNISDEGSMCGSRVEGRIIELGEVCYQHPAPGKTQGQRLPVSLRVQRDDPRRGNIGTHNEWRLMPDLIGKTFEGAITAMKRAGFEREDVIQHVWADEDTCKPLVVCRQYPEPLERAGLNDGKVLYVGQDRPAKPPAGEPRVLGSAQPTRTEVPSPPAPTDGSPARTDASPSRSDAKSTRSEPSRTAEASTTAAADEPKHYGGNGALAYRDAANVPHGPGGPIFMGRGVPCTNKIDHCMRPGVWFAADNVIAGKLFRGTPAFELDGAWWNWRGEQLEPKFLFRTKVADSSSELLVGKPVVFLVADGGRKWLDNEHDMLTTSRWSVGVIDSVSADAIIVRGWNSVPIEATRVIVEEKQPQQ